MNKNAQHNGIGFCGLLALVFIVLKLCGVIHWSWLWILAPLWISGIIIIGIMVAFVFIEGVWRL